MHSPEKGPPVAQARWDRQQQHAQHSVPAGGSGVVTHDGSLRSQRRDGHLELHIPPRLIRGGDRGRRRPRLHNPDSGGRAVDVIQRCGEVHRRCHRPRVGTAATAGHTCARSSFGDWASQKLSNKCKMRTVAFEAGAWRARRQPLAGAALAAGGGRDLHTLVARGVRPHHERGRADHVPVVHDRMAQTLNLCTAASRHHTQFSGSDGTCVAAAHRVRLRLALTGRALRVGVQLLPPSADQAVAIHRHVLHGG